MSGRFELPERLRRALAADPRPVTPLRPPALRVVDVALWGLAILLAAPLTFPLRHDAAVLGVMMTWGAAVIEAVAGVLVVILALREAVPGAGIGRARGLVALLAGIAVQSGVALLTWMSGPAVAGAEVARHAGGKCLAMQAVLGGPALAITLFLAVRALPVRPPLAGALAGLGAGLLADGAWHLICPVTDLGHLLLWHGAATAIMIGTGWLLGVAWRRRERARLAARLPSSSGSA